MERKLPTFFLATAIAIVILVAVSGISVYYAMQFPNALQQLNIPALIKIFIAPVSVVIGGAATAIYGSRIAHKAELQGRGVVPRPARGSAPQMIFGREFEADIIWE
jgi:hypothetical protein